MLTVDYDRLGVHAGDRVLDLGCGGGRHAVEARRRGAHVVALDCDEEELRAVQQTLASSVDDVPEGGFPPGSQTPSGSQTQSGSQAQSGSQTPSGSQTRGRADAVRADARKLPFPDATFDRVIAAEVLEHVHDDGGVLAEIQRVLRPGGRVAVTVPRFWPEVVCWALSRAYHEVEGGHVRIYRRSQLRRRARAAGMRWLATHHAHALHSPFWWLKCAVGVERSPWPVRVYHQVLVWDIMRGPAVTRVTEKILNPVLGKSLVVYLERPGGHGDAVLPARDEARVRAGGRL